MDRGDFNCRRGQDISLHYHDRLRGLISQATTGYRRRVFPRMYSCQSAKPSTLFRIDGRIHLHTKALMKCQLHPSNETTFLSPILTSSRHIFSTDPPEWELLLWCLRDISHTFSGYIRMLSIIYGKQHGHNRISDSLFTVFYHISIDATKIASWYNVAM
jgi:hypothetical protein